MTTAQQSPPQRKGTKPKTKPVAWAGVILLVVIGIFFGTKVVPNDDPLLQGTVAFDAETFGQDNFPTVQEGIAERAVPAGELAAALTADQEAATAQYGQEASSGPIFAVSFTGVVGEGSSGIYAVQVDETPEDLLIRVQTGPAINGTELRDATGDMSFGDFANQIQFQDAAAALNDEMKQQVLGDVDTGDLEGQTITVTGAFTLINPDSWLVTPVQLELQ